jgi:hypothetical protein
MNTLVSNQAAPEYGKETYTSSDLAIPECDSDKFIPVPYMKNGDLAEGISGRAPIDSTYENFSVQFIEHPKTIKRIEPMGEERYPHRAE